MESYDEIETLSEAGWTPEEIAELTSTPLSEVLSTVTCVHGVALVDECRVCIAVALEEDEREEKK